MKPGRPRLLSLAAVAAVVLAGCAPALNSTGNPAASGGSGRTEEATAWDSVTAGIRADGYVDVATALGAFGLAVAPLPGVEIPTGRRTPLISGSGAIRWLLGHWDDLSDPQRQAVVDLVGRDPFAATGEGAAEELGPGGPHVELVARFDAADSPGAGPYRQLFDKYVAEIGAKLTPQHTLSVPTRIVMDQKQSGDGDAYTFALGPKQGHLTDCELHITPRLPTLSGVDIDVAMAHEAFHCIQSDLFPTVKDGDDTLAASPWLVEGEAAWVGEVVAGPDDGRYTDPWWDGYLTEPRSPLTKRDYDAIGFYSHMDETGNDPWPVLVPMLTAGASSAAFQVATSAARDPFLMSWPSGIFRRPGWGSAWDTTGPGIPGPGVAGPVQLLTVANGQPAQVSAAAFANELSEIDTSADVTSVGTQGYARIRDSAALDVVAQPGIEVDLCTRNDGKCDCPDNAGPPPTPAQSPLRMGLTGGANAATAAIGGQSVAEFCKTRKQKKPSKEAWCAAVIRVNRKYGYLVGDPPQYLPPDKLTPDMLRGIVEETLAQEQDYMAITPEEILHDVQLELQVFHAMRDAGYDLRTIQAAPPGFVQSQKELLDYQVQNCGILPPPK